MAMGCVNVDEMLESVSSAQITEWKAFYRVSPFGEERADIRAAQICHLLTAGLGVQKKGGKFSLFDFMPFTEKPKDNRSVIDKIKGMFGG